MHRLVFSTDFCDKEISRAPEVEALLDLYALNELAVSFCVFI